jgi:plastocyanin
VTVTAQGIAYLEKEITVPADQPFTIAFDNRDAGVPHDIVIKDAAGATLFQGARTDGPVVVVYDVPALPAGQYTFVCSFHPNMTGTVTAQ